MFKHEKDLLLFDRDSCDSTLREEGFIYGSQTLWIISSKELIAIRLASEQFEHIISDIYITIETDCAAVYWLLKLRTGEIEIGRK